MQSCRQWARECREYGFWGGESEEERAAAGFRVPPGCDAQVLIDYPWDVAIFHPPCTHTSVSGAKWFADKWADGRQAAGVSFFMSLVRRAAHIPRTAFEQPVSVLSRLYRKPDQIIQPWQFGHGETKATCLWLDGLPLLMPTNVVDGREARVHKMAPGPDRARERSATYQGVADAMAMQWGGLVAGRA